MRNDIGAAPPSPILGEYGQQQNAASQAPLDWAYQGFLSPAAWAVSTLETPICIDFWEGKVSIIADDFQALFFLQ